MKKIILFLFLLAITTLNSQNLLKNPSFDGIYGASAEFENCAPNYFYNPDWTSSNPASVTFSRNTDLSFCRSSLNSQKVSITSINTYCYFAQSIEIRGKRILSASLWVYSTTSGKSIELMIRSRQQYNPSVASKIVSLNLGWQKIEIIGSTACIVNDNNIYTYDFFVNFKSIGTFYLDDASVIDETNQQNSETNLILNPNFEQRYNTESAYPGCASNFFFNPNWDVNPPSDIEFSRDTDNSLSGFACQKAVIDSINGYCYYAQGFNIAQNRKIKASIWVKSTTNNFTLDFALRSRNEYNPNVAIKTNITLNDNNWHKIEIYGDTGNIVSNTTTPNIDLFINLKSTGVVYFDDALVTDVTDLEFYKIEDGLPDLLVNSDFEDNFGNNGMADSYESHTDWSNAATVVFSKDTCSPQNGFNCQKIEVISNPTYCYYNQGINVIGNKIFKATAWVKSPNNIEIDFTLRSRLDHYPPISSARTLIVGNDWQKIEIIGGMGSMVEETQSYILDFFINIRNTGTLYIDNLSVVDVTDIIKNTDISLQTAYETIPRSFFGMHINRLAQHEWPSVDFGTLRLWDSGTKWAEIETVNDTWNWNNTDLYINQRNSNNPTSNIIYTLGMPALWATNSTISFAGAYQSVNNLADWEDYVTTIGNKYNGVIKYWEIWNEIETFFRKGSNNLDINLLANSAYTILKNINPNNIILSPNFTTSTAASDFIFKCNGNYYFDVFSFHKYTDIKPENEIGVFYGFRNLLDNFGLQQIPMWNTEGANIKGFQSADSSFNDLRIGAVSRAYIIQWLYDVKNFNWYFWEPYNDTVNNDNWAITGTTLSNDDNSLTTAGQAYAYIVDWLKGKKMISKKIDINNNWIIKLYNPTTDKDEFLVWNASNNSSTFTIPSSWGLVNKKDLFTNSLTVVSNFINTNAAPILLIPTNNVFAKPSLNEIPRNIDDSSKFSVYPNPADKYFILQKGKDIHNVKAKLYDINGRVVIDNIILNNEITTIDVERLEKGIYILHIENEINFNLKIIKR